MMRIPDRCRMGLAAALVALTLDPCGVASGAGGPDDGAQLPQRKPFQAKHKLEEDMEFWGYEWAGGNVWNIENTQTQALEGKALRCASTGGQPYSSILVYRPFPPYPAATKFNLSLAFQYSAKKVSGSNTPPVQAIEFKVGKWQQPQCFEWRLQWRGGGDHSPCWSYWDPEAKDPWVRTSLPADLAEGVWHSLKMECRIRNGKVYYDSLIIDGKTNALSVSVPAAKSNREENRLSVGFQLTANAKADACEMIVDQVNFGD